MADKNLELSLRISGDAKSGIAAFRDLKTSVEETRAKLNQATEHIKGLVQAANIGKLKLLEDAQREADGAAKKLQEAKRQLDFFQRSAEIGGAKGMKEFGADIDKAKLAVTKASAELEKHNAQVEKIRTTAATALPEYAKQLDRAKASAGLLKDRLTQQTVELEKSRRAMSAMGIDVTKLASEQARLNKVQTDSAQRMSEWARQASTGGAAIKQLSAGQAEYIAKAKAAADVDQARQVIGVKAHAAIKAEIDKVNQAYSTLKNSGLATTQELAQAKLKLLGRIQELKAETNGWAEVFGKVRESAASLLAMLAGLTVATRQAIEFESAMANVAKVVDFPTPDGLDELKAQIIDLTRVTPMTVIELAKLAEAGGQMGIAAQDLAKFTEVAAKMSTAFGISATEAGDAIARLTNIYRLTITEVERLGDSVNALGNNFSATEAGIVNVMNRVGGTAKVFGLTARETAALATAFLDLGRPPEIASNAINALLVTLQTVETAEPAVRDALDGIGISAEQLARDILANPQKALEGLLTTLEGLSASEKTNVLKQLFGREYVDDIALLTTGLDKYKAALKQAVAEENAGGMNREFQKRMETTSAELGRATNAFKELGIAIGSTFLPVISMAADIAGGLARALAAVADALGPLTPVIAGIVTVFAGWSAITVVVSAVGLVISKLAMAVGGLAAVFNPWVLIVGAAVGVISSFWGEISSWLGLSEPVDAMLAKQASEFDGYAAKLRGVGAEWAAAKVEREKYSAMWTEDPEKIAAALAEVQDFTQKVGALYEKLDGENQLLANLRIARERAVSGQTVLSEEEALKAKISAMEAAIKKAEGEADARIAEAKRYHDEAIRMEEEAAGIRQSTVDKLRELRRRDMDEAGKQADIQSEANSKMAESAKLLAIAADEAGKGNTDASLKAAESAKKLAGEAEALGGRLTDTKKAYDVVSRSGDLMAKSADAAAKALNGAATEAEKDAERIKTGVGAMNKELEALKKQQVLIKIDADISRAIKNIAAIKTEIAGLQDKTINITTVHRTVTAKSSGGLITGPGPARFARGGAVGKSAAPARFAQGGSVSRFSSGRIVNPVNSPGVARFAFGGWARNRSGANSPTTVGAPQSWEQILGNMGIVLTDEEMTRFQSSVVAVNSYVKKYIVPESPAARYAGYSSDMGPRRDNRVMQETISRTLNLAIDDGAMKGRIFGSALDFFKERTRQQFGFAIGGIADGLPTRQSDEFPALPGGVVPGSGNGDTVPRTLDVGAYVLRKSAVQRYGLDGLTDMITGAMDNARAIGNQVRAMAGGAGAKMRALLTPGEVVVPRDIVARVGVNVLDRINTSRFATGGIVGSAPASSSSAGSTVVKTIELVLRDHAGQGVTLTAPADSESLLMSLVGKLQTEMGRAA